MSGIVVHPPPPRPRRIRRVGVATAARMLLISREAVRGALRRERLAPERADTLPVRGSPWTIPICCVRAYARREACPVCRWGDAPDEADLEPAP